ncbi:MAG: helicase-related protein [Planctomycetia bacterium]|nr:helicase-related protein [Planctomycetia bacterium]
MPESAFKFSPGSLITARGRDWIVLPTPLEFDPLLTQCDPPLELVYARPIDGTEEEATAILLNESSEPVQSSHFAPPTTAQMGNYRSCQRLRNALRFGVRNGAGPFRSFGRLSFDPRPFQLLPLILALKQEYVRLLIADDVGIGKTIETGLIIRELLDRGEIKRFCVVCPPCLAEQWRDELREKFNLDAQLVLSSTVNRLESNCLPGESIFEAYPYTIVSVDFIKSKTRRNEFERTAPEFLVFDEAHSVVSSAASSFSQQRFDLAKALCTEVLANGRKRHVVLVTATPHTGKDQAFRNLLGLLDEKFLDEQAFPTDLGGDANRAKREELARYFVQRRRKDVESFLGESTRFPQSKTINVQWELSSRYKELYDEAIQVAQELVQVTDEHKNDKQHALEQRVRYWSALSLLRCMASSPAAAYSTLLQRSLLAPTAQHEVGEGEESDVTQEEEDVVKLRAEYAQYAKKRFQVDGDDPDFEKTRERIDQVGRAYVYDVESTSDSVQSDNTLGADPGALIEEPSKRRKTFRELAEKFRELADSTLEPDGFANDAKLVELIAHVTTLLKEEYSPVVFCRFIPTAEYVAKRLRTALVGKRGIPKDLAVIEVNGKLPPEERERRILEGCEHEGKILVCTDCLSEGVNLQEDFNAVIHYDLSWNPTLHEQREGRVDRFGQVCDEVRNILFCGRDNDVDSMIFRVILEKHRKIKRSLGVSTPTPPQSSELFESFIASYLAAERKKVEHKRKKKGQELSSGFLKGLEPEDLARSIEQEAERNTLELLERITENWNDAEFEKQSRSQTYYAHAGTSSRAIAQVEEALRETKRALGGREELKGFVWDALDACGAVMTPLGRSGAYRIDLSTIGSDVYLRDYLPDYDEWIVRFPEASGSELEQAPGRAQTAQSAPGNSKKGRASKSGERSAVGSEMITRAHPLVEGLCQFILHEAIKPTMTNALALRTGLVCTDAVQRATVLLLLRLRLHIRQNNGKVSGKDSYLDSVAEETVIAGFTAKAFVANWTAKNGEARHETWFTPNSWLNEEEVQRVLSATPSSNAGANASDFIEKALTPIALACKSQEEASQELASAPEVAQEVASYNRALNGFAQARAEALTREHNQVRATITSGRMHCEVTPESEPDVLGVYVYMPR